MAEAATAYAVANPAQALLTIQGLPRDHPPPYVAPGANLLWPGGRCDITTKAGDRYSKAKVVGCEAAGQGKGEVYVHRLALIAAGRHLELSQDAAGNAIDTTQGGTHEASHLCHNRKCVNAHHIVVEEKEVNVSRNFCVRLTFPGAAAGQSVTNCTHNPPCLLVAVAGNL